jgi:formate-dependent nitrite reductase membrane component NrfD
MTEQFDTPPDVAPHEEPPVTTAGRGTAWVADHDSETRDMRPATGKRGGPAVWRRARADAHVTLARPHWGDMRWSFLFRRTNYAQAEPALGQVAEASRRMRSGSEPGPVHGPLIKAPVWTWEVPVYFWVGGIAAGSSFVALACDLAGDDKSAATARQVALGAVMPAPLLLIADLGRPGRFLNMLRIFKPRSPMNLGAWCLVAFSATGAAAVGADLIGRPRTARALGAGTAALGSYLGSYTGVLLASTAVPLWASSRLFLGPIFIATATATGAAATRLTLSARGLPHDHPTRRALSTIEAGAMLAELALSTINDRRLGRASDALGKGRPAVVFRGAKLATALGLALQAARGRIGTTRAQHAASACYLAGGLAFRFAWVEAGKASARDDEAVARTARGKITVEDRLGHPPRAARTASSAGPPPRGAPPGGGGPPAAGRPDRSAGPRVDRDGAPRQPGGRRRATAPLYDS